MAFYMPKDIEAVLDELKSENDRAVAVVGASVLEHPLQEAICSVLRGFNDKEDADILKRLFGAQGNFFRTLCENPGRYALKIIGRATQRDLVLINKIRNEFAHDMNPLDFSTDRVSARCKELEIADESLVAEDPRGRYLLATLQPPWQFGSQLVDLLHRVVGIAV